MLHAAHRLFLERGYAATTMPGVFDMAMAGDDEPLPMVQRAALGRVRDEPDPRRNLRLYGEFVPEVAPHTSLSSCWPGPPRPPTRRPPRSGSSCRTSGWPA